MSAPDYSYMPSPNLLPSRPSVRISEQLGCNAVISIRKTKLVLGTAQT
jgi:hypothetical protein